MTIEIKGVHCEVTEEIREAINKKMLRVGYAKDMIVDQVFTLTATRKGHRVESNTNFRWGTSAHLHVEGANLLEALDILTDKLDEKVRKEKDKIQDHSSRGLGQ